MFFASICHDIVTWVAWVRPIAGGEVPEQQQADETTAARRRLPAAVSGAGTHLPALLPPPGPQREDRMPQSKAGKLLHYTLLANCEVNDKIYSSQVRTWITCDRLMCDPGRNERSACLKPKQVSFGITPSFPSAKSMIIETCVRFKCALDP